MLDKKRTRSLAQGAAGIPAQDDPPSQGCSIPALQARAYAWFGPHRAGEHAGVILWSREQVGELESVRIGLHIPFVLQLSILR